MSNTYNNFVKETSTHTQLSGTNNLILNGEEVKRIYLEEIGDVKNKPVLRKRNITEMKSRTEKTRQTVEISDQEIFLAVQNNDIKTLVRVLDIFPEKINLVDNYGWSLLMIGCQANAVCSVKELLKRGVNTSIRDKAGNSAHSLIITSKNLQLAELLLKNNHKTATRDSGEHPKVKVKQKYVCEICNGKEFSDKAEHLISTIHNINASTGKTVLTKYAIPESNRGYQIMLKVGWDKEYGLGPLGSGKKYPIKAVMKKDKRGLGHKEKREAVVKDLKLVNNKILQRQNEISRRQEITFRREFY